METDTYNDRLRARTDSYMKAEDYPCTFVELSEITGIPASRLRKFISGTLLLKFNDAIALLKVVDRKFTILSRP